MASFASTTANTTTTVATSSAGGSASNDENWKDKWDGMFYAYIKRKDVPYFRHVLKGRRYSEREKEWKRIHSTLSASLRK